MGVKSCVVRNMLQEFLLGSQAAALIQEEGYPAETHTVTTCDGYILTIHRIPMSRLAAHTPGSVPGHPVLHLHGYESSSAEVVLRGARNGLGFLLSDQGYDVWLINYRGNTYSRNHTTLSPDQKFGTFW